MIEPPRPSADAHPDDESLLAFAAGRLPDASDVASHLDRCRTCAESVLILRGLDALERTGVPPLSDEEKERNKRSLRRRFGATSDGLVQPAPRPSGGAWASLAGLAGLGALGFGGEAPKPLVAGADPSKAPDSEDQGASKTFQDSEPDAVTRESPEASVEGGGERLYQDPLSELAEAIEQTLGTRSAENAVPFGAPKSSEDASGVAGVDPGSDLTQEPPEAESDPTEIAGYGYEHDSDDDPGDDPSSDDPFVP